MDTVQVNCSVGPQSFGAGLTRHRSRLDTGPEVEGPQRFQIDVGPKHDRAVFNGQEPGMLTPLPAFEPGGIGFETYTEGRSGGEFVLGPLEITVRAK
jgi:hypothetical protein